MERNPKSVQNDKNRAKQKNDRLPSKEQTINVKFVKPKGNNQSNTSTTPSVIPNLPSPKTRAPPLTTPKNPLIGNKNERITNARGNDTKPKSTGVYNRRAPGEKAHTSGSPGQTNQIVNTNTKNQMVKVMSVATSDHLQPPLELHTSTENGQSPDKDVHLENSKRRLQLPGKNPSRSIGPTPHHSRSTKKFRDKKSTLANAENEVEVPQPTQMDEECALELNKIAQILKGVTAFDASTSTENSAIKSGISVRFKFHSRSEGDQFLGHTGTHPSLSQSKSIQ